MTGYKRVSEMTLEEKREKVAGFNVMDDVFFQKMMEDKEVCEEILRIILEDSKMRVMECVPQASIKNLNGKSVVLDVLCRDSDGKYCNVEVQKADDDDHQKRVRYNAALVSMYTMQAGKDYKELPDVKVVFISRFDVFKADHVLWSSIFVTLQPNFCYGIIRHHNVPRKAFCNYCKNADVHDYNVHMQILPLQYTVLFLSDNNVDRLTHFLMY